MSIFKAIIGFADLRDDVFQTKAATIETKMTGNPNFPSPIPSMSVISPLILAYSEALKKSNGGRGGVEATAVKNQCRKELEKSLQDLGRYVESSANNDYLILLSSGYDIKGKPSPGTEPETPQNLRLTDGEHSGECFVKFDGVYNATMYMIRYTNTPSNAASWITPDPFTGASYLIKNQVVKSDLFVQVKATNGHGVSDWTESAMWIIR